MMRRKTSLSLLSNKRILMDQLKRTEILLRKKTRMMIRVDMAQMKAKRKKKQPMINNLKKRNYLAKVPLSDDQLLEELERIKLEKENSLEAISQLDQMISIIHPLKRKSLKSQPKLKNLKPKVLDLLSQHSEEE